MYITLILPYVLLHFNSSSANLIVPLQSVWNNNNNAVHDYLRLFFSDLRRASDFSMP